MEKGIKNYKRLKKLFFLDITYTNNKIKLTKAEAYDKADFWRDLEIKNKKELNCFLSLY